MARRGLGLLLVLATAASATGCGSAGGGAPARRAGARVPTVSAAPGPASTCFVASATCTIHPCVEFATAPAPKVLVPTPHATCNRYPSPRARLAFVRQ